MRLGKQELRARLGKQEVVVVPVRLEKLARPALRDRQGLRGPRDKPD